MKQQNSKLFRLNMLAGQDFIFKAGMRRYFLGARIGFLHQFLSANLNSEGFLLLIFLLKSLLNLILFG